MLKFQSIKTNSLTKNQKKQICLLKDSNWKYGLKSQLKYLKKIAKSNDLHNCFFKNDKLIGYTFLRKRKFAIKSKKYNYLLFDTIVVLKKFRKKKLSTIMMSFNNLTIKKQKLPSFLICSDKYLDFYKKFKWLKLKNNNFKIVNRKDNLNVMYFNIKKSLNNKRRIKIYIN